MRRTRDGQRRGMVMLVMVTWHLPPFLPLSPSLTGGPEQENMTDRHMGSGGPAGGGGGGGGRALPGSPPKACSLPFPSRQP